MLASYKEMWVRAFDFEGRTSRRNYWQAFLISTIIGGVILFLPESLHNILIWLFAIPGISAGVRRMRSAGYSPIKLLWIFVPFVGGFIALYFLAQPDKEV